MFQCIKKRYSSLLLILWEDATEGALYEVVRAPKILGLYEDSARLKNLIEKNVACSRIYQKA